MLTVTVQHLLQLGKKTTARKSSASRLSSASARVSYPRSIQLFLADSKSYSSLKNILSLITGNVQTIIHVSPKLALALLGTKWVLLQFHIPPWCWGQTECRRDAASEASALGWFSQLQGPQGGRGMVAPVWSVTLVRESSLWTVLF